MSENIQECYKYSEERKFTVYMHVVPKEINGYGHDKYYIGITGTSVEQRWGKDGCRYKLSNRRNEGLFYRAIKKYGWDNIRHVILSEGLTEQEAWNEEVRLIEKYKSNDPQFGYNITSGGGGTNGMTHSEETKKLLSNMYKGKKKNREDIYHIVQFSLDGTFVKFYDRTSDIKEIDGVYVQDVRSTIWRAVHGKSKTAYGYVWRYSDDVIQTSDGHYLLTEKDIKLIKTIKKRKKVFKFSMSGEFIAKFDNTSDAAKSEGTTYTGIFADACRTKTPRKGYIWLYEDDVEYIDGTWIIKNFQSTDFESCLYKAVFQFDKTGKFVNEYSSLYEAERKTGISRHTISHNLTLDNPHTKNGYIWRGINHVRKENDTYVIKTNEIYY